MKTKMMVSVRSWFPVVMAVLFALPSVALCAQVVTLFTGDSKEIFLYDAAFRDVTGATLIGPDKLPVPYVTTTIALDPLKSGVRVRVTVAPKVKPGNYQLILVYGSRQKLTPVVVEVRLSGPDLKVLDYNPATNVFRVTNVGNQDAVFPQGGRLLSYGENRSRIQDGRVPAGGKVTPGQIIEINFGMPPNWYCPDPNAELQYGFYDIWWSYALPEPMDAAGHRMLLVDPDNKIAEADETNNTYQITRLNPYKGVIQGSGAPDIVISKIEMKKITNGQNLYIDLKNAGSKTSYCCSSGTLFNGYVDGRNLIHAGMPFIPFVLQPGEERYWRFFLVDEIKDQYGVSNGGLPSACHEVRIEIDPFKHIPGEISCNNLTYYYFASGSATCDPSKVMRRSQCPQPLPLQR